ncbi:UNVERIFIED_CONTAM: hypothetical protein FKN15_077379 [Acipenser sinensis]
MPPEGVLTPAAVFTPLESLGLGPQKWKLSATGREGEVELPLPPLWPEASLPSTPPELSWLEGPELGGEEQVPPLSPSSGGEVELPLPPYWLGAPLLPLPPEGPHLPSPMEGLLLLRTASLGVTGSASPGVTGTAWPGVASSASPGVACSPSPGDVCTPPPGDTVCMLLARVATGGPEEASVPPPEL